jgi:hypothetical protein
MRGAFQSVYLVEETADRLFGPVLIAMPEQPLDPVHVLEEMV